MRLHSKAPLRCAFPFCRTTYTRTGGFCREANPQFSAVVRQNPPVLQLSESACSPAEQPLSAGCGRKRYKHTRLFGKSRVPRNLWFHWILPAKEGAALLWIPPAKAAPPPLESTANGNAIPIGFPSQQGAAHPSWMTPSHTIHSWRANVQPPLSSHCTLQRGFPSPLDSLVFSVQAGSQIVHPQFPTIH